MNKLYNYDLIILHLKAEEERLAAKHKAVKAALAETRKELAAAITARRKAKRPDLIL